MKPPTAETPSPRRGDGWWLWVDGVGGFLVLPGQRWTLGGAAAGGQVDIAILADCPRDAGRIERQGEDYGWVDRDGGRTWLRHGDSLPLAGTARVTFGRPSPLSSSASLRVAPPHRWLEPADAIVLLETSCLIGRGAGNHVVCPQTEDTWTLTLGRGGWKAGRLGSGSWTPLTPGRRTVLGEIAVTLEPMPARPREGDAAPEIGPARA